MILPSQNMGNVHQRIVNRITEHKGRGAISPANNKITDIGAIEFLWALDQIIELNSLLPWHTKT